MMNIWAFLTVGIIGSIAKRVLSALGIGVVSYVGFDQLLSYVLGRLKHHLSELPAAALSLAGKANVDIAINIVFSAYAVSLTLMVAKKLFKS